MRNNRCKPNFNKRHDILNVTQKEVNRTNSIYVTDSYIQSWGAGGSVVSYHELNALKQVSDVSQVYQRVGKLFFEDYYPQNPFMYDYFIASILKDPEKVDLAHFYGSSFNLTAKLLCKARKFATVPAHNLEESLREWRSFKYWMPPPPHLTDDALFRFLCHGLYEVTVITPSVSSADYLKKKHGLESVLIPHGTDIPPTYNTERKEFNILHISQFGCDKGQKYLVKAWKQLQNLPMTLTMCCQNIPESFVVGLQNLKLCSNISEEEKADLYKNASAYVQPSVTEGWGLCLQADEDIVDFKGVKPIKDVVVGDLVLTHRGNFKKVTKIFERDYIGDMIAIKPSKYYCSIRLTPEHPVLAFKRPRKKWKKGRMWESQKPEWILARDIEKGDCVIYPKANQIYNKLTDNTPALAEIIGWYIAEGSPLQNSGGIEFTLNSEKEEDIAKHLANLLDVLFGLKTGIKRKRDTKCLSLYGPNWILGLLFPKLCGRGAENKKLPRSLLFGFLKPLEIMLDAIAKGDGYKVQCHNSSKYVMRYSTASKMLAHDLLLGLVRLGIEPSIQRFAARAPLGKLPIYEVSYVIAKEKSKGNRSWITKQGDLAILVESVSIEKYTGKVYNLEIEDDNSYTTGFFAVHNCVAEAMSHGVPVIVTEGVGASDMVTDGKDGFVIPIRDPKIIEDKIMYFYDNPSEVKRMGENARKKAENYSWDKIEKKYEALFA